MYTIIAKTFDRNGTMLIYHPAQGFTGIYGMTNVNFLVDSTNKCVSFVGQVTPTYDGIVRHINFSTTLNNDIVWMIALDQMDDLNLQVYAGMQTPVAIRTCIRLA